MESKIESNAVRLAKENNSKQNNSSLANLKYKPRGLIAANNNVYKKIRKKILVVFYFIKCSSVKSAVRC